MARPWPRSFDGAPCGALVGLTGARVSALLRHGQVVACRTPPQVLPADLFPYPAPDERVERRGNVSLPYLIALAELEQGLGGRDVPVPEPEIRVREAVQDTLAPRALKLRHRNLPRDEAQLDEALQVVDDLVRAVPPNDAGDVARPLFAGGDRAQDGVVERLPVELCPKKPFRLAEEDVAGRKDRAGHVGGQIAVRADVRQVRGRAAEARVPPDSIIRRPLGEESRGIQVVEWLDRDTSARRPTWETARRADMRLRAPRPLAWRRRLERRVPTCAHRRRRRCACRARNRRGARISRLGATPQSVTTRAPLAPHASSSCANSRVRWTNGSGNTLRSLRSDAATCKDSDEPVVVVAREGAVERGVPQRDRVPREMPRRLPCPPSQPGS